MAEGRNGEDDLERAEALVNRLVRQRAEAASRRQAEAAEPSTRAGPPPQRDGRPAAPAHAPPPQPAAPARTPLPPPGGAPRTRTPFKTVEKSGAPVSGEPPAPSIAAGGAVTARTPQPAASIQAAAPPKSPAQTRPAAFSAPGAPVSPEEDRLEDQEGVHAGGDVFADFDAPPSASPPPQPREPRSGGAPWVGGEASSAFDAPARAESRPESRASAAQEAEAAPFALERRPLKVPRAEAPPVFPPDEEEEEPEATLDLTNRVPLTSSATARPFSGFEWGVAGRYLRARRKDGFISVISWLSLAGIALGVAALIVVMAVMTGFRQELITQLLGVNAHASVAPQMTVPPRPFSNYAAMAAKLGAEHGVIQAAPVIEAQVMGRSDAGSALVYVRGVRPEDFRRMKPVADPETSEGSLETFREDRGVAIGSRLAFKLGLRVGDRITLLTESNDLTPFGSMPFRSKTYQVAYVFKLGMSEYDEVLLYMPLEEAQLFFGKEGIADAIDVMVQDPQNVERLEPALYRAAGEPVSVFTWKNRNASYIGALDMERLVMRLILSLIILIAAFNIVSGLIMLVKEKGRDVAILRTIGLSRGSVMRIFFICGASIGVIGTLAGVLLGVTIALNIGAIQGFVENVFGAKVFPDDIYFLSHLPSKLQWSDVAITAAISLGVSFLATIFPARRAARLDPVEALRYE